jgi:hypothetical protein
MKKKNESKNAEKSDNKAPASASATDDKKAP